MEHNEILATTTWVLLWVHRAQCNATVAFYDVILYFLIGTWTYWDDVFVLSRLVILVFFLIFWISPGSLLQIAKSKYTANIEQETVGTVLRPMIFPSRTTHVRLFPQKHSFSYPYLLVGIPVGWHGEARSILSVDSPASRTWLQVYACDYLSRQSSVHDLGSKLRSYLENEGVEENKYPYAYLVTAPRVLGYSFNPVSFWYLYSADQKLEAIILEVNNTFDERRMYFLRREQIQNDKPSPKCVSACSGCYGHGSCASEIHKPEMADRFSISWEKDFHVSPFNSRDGSYSLLATDPRPFRTQKDVSLSNTITLLSPENRPKMVARIFSTGSPIDPIELAGWHEFEFVLRWICVGFLTFPRILKEAWKLYFQKKLRIWYRPEVTDSSIARRSTINERCLETFFLSYLQHSVGHAAFPLRLTYTRPLDIGPEVEIFSKFSTSKEAESNHLEIRVISPSFYRRFVHYAQTVEAFNLESLGIDPKSRSVSVSPFSLLVSLFPPESDPQTLTPVLSSLGRGDRVRWNILKLLRSSPSSAQNYADVPKTVARPESRSVCCTNLSQLDVHVIENCPDQWRYRRQAVLVFLGQRLACGVPFILEIADLTFRLLLTVAGWRLVSINKWLDHSKSTPLDFVMACMKSSLVVGIHNSIHAWELLKGL